MGYSQKMIVQKFFSISLQITKLISISLLLSIIAGCSSFEAYIANPQKLDPGRLPEPNVSVNIPNLGPCTDSSDRIVRFNSNQPVTILVHGCNGSAGRFRSLAQLYAFHGQQAICFSYDDRDSLIDVSNQLISALEQLSEHTDLQTISVIGHSMGGLIARKALEEDIATNDSTIKLTTVSAPLAGINDAKTCGKEALHWISLGIVPAICWGITGDNWFEITSASDFIKKPAPLSSSVQRYLKVVTNEENTCRVDQNGTCIASDHIFELEEQYHPVIDQYPQVTNVQVDAGHVEIVGYKDVIPRKLLSILQEQGMLVATPPERQAALEELLTELYLK
jgi:hypothetical protein